MTERTIFPGTVRGTISAPPSKSYTHRELLAAFFSPSDSRIDGPLESCDTRATLEGIVALGARVLRKRDSWLVAGSRDRRPPRGKVRIHCGDSGTTLRFLAAASASLPEEVALTGSHRLALRPVEPLLGVLEAAGARIRRTRAHRSLPLRLRGPIGPVVSRLDASQSSQFLSALLFVLPTIAGDSRVTLFRAPVSRPYVEVTLDTLDRHGVEVHRRGPVYRIPGSQTFRGGRSRVPGDASSASYLWAAAAASGGSVRVTGIPADRPQADLLVLRILRRMGVQVERDEEGARASGRASRPVDVDLTDTPDLYPLVGTLAALVPGTSRLRGASHLASKESDRRLMTARIARALGARVRARDGGLTIEGRENPRPIRLGDLGDHRIVMSAAVGALAASGTSTIADAGAVAKSFPGFWHALEALGGHSEENPG